VGVQKITRYTIDPSASVNILFTFEHDHWRGSLDSTTNPLHVVHSKVTSTSRPLPKPTGLENCVDWQDWVG
jgi:hypothetical protein